MATTEAFRHSRNAQFIAVMLESLLVGIFASLFVFIVWIMRTNYRTMSKMHKVLFAATIFMFALSVFHLGLVMQEMTVDSVPIAWVRVQIVLSMFQYVTGDLVLIWRVWVMWGRNYVIASGPLILMLVAAAFTLHLTSGKGGDTFFTVVPVALIVANTTLCTVLIAGKVWYTNRKATRISTSAGARISGHYKKIMILIIESGALYASCQIISLILHYTESVALPVILDLQIPLIGILPTLIIVFVHFGVISGARNPSTIGSAAHKTSHIKMDVMSLPTSKVYSSEPSHIGKDFLPLGYPPTSMSKAQGRFHAS